MLLSILGMRLPARYIKLMHPLQPNPFNLSLLALQISPLRVLEVLIEECAPCMPRWKYTILDGIGRCWVTLKDSGGISTDSELRTRLQHTCASLAKSCPSVVEDEYKRLLSSDPKIFGDLLNGVSV